MVSITLGVFYTPVSIHQPNSGDSFVASLVASPMRWLRGCLPSTSAYAASSLCLCVRPQLPIAPAEGPDEAPDDRRRRDRARGNILITYPLDASAGKPHACSDVKISVAHLTLPHETLASAAPLILAPSPRRLTWGL